MSKSEGVSAKPIPMGILVSVSGKACKAKRPVPKRHHPSPTRPRPIPQMWVALFAGFALAVMMVGISLSTVVLKHSLPSKRHAFTPPITHASYNPSHAPTPFMQEKSNGQVEREVEAERRPLPRHLPQPMRDASMVRDYVGSPTVPRKDAVLEPIAVPDTRSQDSTPAARQEMDSSAPAKCEQPGASIRFIKDPPEAFQLARAEKKLVFMLHLSGNFEDTAFT